MAPTTNRRPARSDRPSPLPFETLHGMTYCPANSRLRLAFALVPALVGASVMLGWIFDVNALQTVLPGMASMKFNTALGFLLAGVGLAMSQEGLAPAALRQSLASFVAIVVVLLGAVTLAEYASGVSLRLDQALIADRHTNLYPASLYPGRMSPATAVCFVFVGAAVLLIANIAFANAQRARQLASLAHGLALVPAVAGYLTLAGYAYDVQGFYTLDPSSRWPCIRG